jgi:hypothetical protein
MPRRADGSVIQSCLRFERGDFAHEFIQYPVLGVVLSVFPSDDSQNAEARTYQDQRGTQLQARVLVINDGQDTAWELPNVVVTPLGSSGFDNFSEEVPRGTTGMVDGSKFDWNLLEIEPRRLNGDWCIIDFVGGSINQPFMVTWWPHPSNRRDSMTGGEVEIANDPREGNLQQSRRLVKRFQGTRFSVTSQGDVFLDTSQAASVLDENGERKKVEDGGEVDITIKDTQRLQVNFNPSVADEDAVTNEIYEGHPDVLQQRNPAQGANARDDLLTRLFLDKDFVTAVAGRVIQLRGDNDGTGSTDTVLLGEPSNNTPEQHVIKGEDHKDTYDALVARINAFMAAYETHIHASSNGNTTAPIDPSVPESTYQNMCYPFTGTEPPPSPGPACFAAGYAATAGGDAYLTDAADLAAVAAIIPGSPTTPPPSAPGVTRADNMPAADLSDVVKTE